MMNHAKENSPSKVGGALPAINKRTGWQTIQLVPELGGTRQRARLCLEPGLTHIQAAPFQWRAGPPSVAKDVLLLEALMEPRMRLILVNLSARELRVNDLIAPSMAVLHERDQFRYDRGQAWQVAVFIKPRIETPGMGLAEAQCPVCLRRLGVEGSAYWCVCGVAMHFQDDPSVCCARTAGECLSCGRPVVLRESFASGEPDIDRE